jgi:hypothetical protein
MHLNFEIFKSLACKDLLPLYTHPLEQFILKMLVRNFGEGLMSSQDSNLYFPLSEIIEEIIRRS